MSQVFNPPELESNDTHPTAYSFGHPLHPFQYEAATRLTESTIEDIKGRLWDLHGV